MNRVLSLFCVSPFLFLSFFFLPVLVAVYKSPLIFLPDFFFSLVALHFYDMKDLSFMTSPFSCYLVVKDV